MYWRRAHCIYMTLEERLTALNTCDSGSLPLCTSLIVWVHRANHINSRIPKQNGETTQHGRHLRERFPSVATRDTNHSRGRGPLNYGVGEHHGYIDRCHGGGEQGHYCFPKAQKGGRNCHGENDSTEHLKVLQKTDGTRHRARNGFCRNSRVST